MLTTQQQTFAEVKWI